MPGILTGPNAITQPITSSQEPNVLVWSFRHDMQQWELVPTRPREIHNVSVNGRLCTARIGKGPKHACGKGHDRTDSGSGLATSTTLEKRPRWAAVGHLAMMQWLCSDIEHAETGTISPDPVDQTAADGRDDGKAITTRNGETPQGNDGDSMNLRGSPGGRRIHGLGSVSNHNASRSSYRSTAERGYTAVYPPPIPSLPDIAIYPSSHPALVEHVEIWSSCQQQRSQASRERTNLKGGKVKKKKTFFLEHLKENDKLFRTLKGEKDVELGRKKPTSLWRFVRGGRSK